MFTLMFVDAGSPRAHRLREGETLIGRAPHCDLTITTASISRQHASVRVSGDRVFLRDAGSRHGTLLRGLPVLAEHELTSGDQFVVGEVPITLHKDIAAEDLLSESHELLEDSGTLLRHVEQMGASSPQAATAPSVPVQPPAEAPAADTTSLHHSLASASLRANSAVAGLTPHPETTWAPQPEAGERRRGEERRKVDLGRAEGDRRSGHDRRGSRMLNLLTEISKTLVTVQPLAQVLARVVDLVFGVLPAERAFLLLRDSIDEPLTARVMRNRDGSVPANASLSRTIVNRVMRERVAMLAKDAIYDPRLDASGSVHAMHIRSFMCAPLWNRNEVTGVLYCDNPRSKQFSPDDLDVFGALCNYAAVAVEQARLSQQLLEETKRRERLQRYHSPGVISRIIHSQDSEGILVTQERDVSVMFCDVVGFTSLCQHLEPPAVGDLLNTFFARMCEVIFEHEGTLDKFIGDAILAVFGAPFDQPDHAARCVAAALAMKRQLVEVNRLLERTIRVRIAVNSGRALTGDVGSPKRREFTVLGDVVNVAARIESSVAQPDQIVVSQHTRERLGCAFQLKALGGVTLRGCDGPLEMFEVLG